MASSAVWLWSTATIVGRLRLRGGTAHTMKGSQLSRNDDVAHDRDGADPHDWDRRRVFLGLDSELLMPQHREPDISTVAPRGATTWTSPTRAIA